MLLIYFWLSILSLHSVLKRDKKKNNSSAAAVIVDSSSGASSGGKKDAVKSMKWKFFMQLKNEVECHEFSLSLITLSLSKGQHLAVLKL